MLAPLAQWNVYPVKSVRLFNWGVSLFHRGEIFAFLNPKVI